MSADKRKKIAIFCSVLALLLIVQEAALFKFDRKNSLLIQARQRWMYASAIDRGIKFYSPEKIEKLKIDEYLLFREISRRKNIADTAALEEKYSADPFRRIWGKNRPAGGLKFYLQYFKENDGQPIDNSFYYVNKPYDAFLNDPWDDVMLKALYCDIAGYDDHDFNILETIGRGDGGYWDTHLLLGLIFLEGNGCYVPEKIKNKTEEAVADIISAQRSDNIFSDLYAERIVLLYWAGRGDQVEKEWADIVRDNLTRDPGWRSGGSFSSNAHTTGLALLSLMYYREGENKQAFYR